jgi:glycoside hydrolase-like protein
MTEIIDTNHDTTLHLPALKAAGITTVIRYLSPINPHGEKCIKPAEAHAIAAAGVRLALVCEGWGDFAHGAISGGAGERDGEWCVKYAASVGAPAGACIYFAVDTDASAAQIRKLVLPYFASITTAFAGAELNYRHGVYGSGNVCDAVLAASLAGLSWLSCSMGWGGSRSYLAANAWALRQHVPATLCGIDCDADDANGEFGDFVPFAAPEPAAAP